MFVKKSQKLFFFKKKKVRYNLGLSDRTASVSYITHLKWKQKR